MSRALGKRLSILVNNFAQDSSQQNRADSLLRHFWISLILLLFSINASGQSPRTNNWVFGDSVLIEFSDGIPTDHLSSMDSFEGSSVISDENGNLEFYTNGITVWNSNHEVMQNGEGLNSDWSATNAALIVPKPNDENLYYVFTVGQYGGNQGGFGGVAYSVVDMSLNQGLGEVIEKNTVLHDKSTEKLCGTLHENGMDFWIMSHDFGNDQFRAFLLTENGIDAPPVISKVGEVHIEWPENDWGANSTGSMRFSPSGCKLGLVLTGQRDTVQVFKFDKKTGYVFDPVNLIAGQNYNNPFLLCFSPDGEKIYVTASDYLYQYDLGLWDDESVQSSVYLLNINTQTGTTYQYDMEDLQIAPNGKIYISRSLTNYLSAINYPNLAGFECDFEAVALSFSYGKCEMGLPNFISNYLTDPDSSIESCYSYCPELAINDSLSVCAGDTLNYTVDMPAGSLLWDDGSSGFTRSIFDEGVYAAHYSFYDCPVQEDSIYVHLIENTVPPLTDTVFCPDEDFQLIMPNQQNSIYEWSNGITGQVFTTSESGIFELEIILSDCTFGDSFVLTEYCEPEITTNLELPNIFTPNGDGLNDLFKPANTQNILSLEISIYNRWGNLVYHNSGRTFSWDGSFNGTKCSGGTYFYIIKYTTINGPPTIRRGSISLNY